MKAWGGAEQEITVMLACLTKQTVWLQPMFGADQELLPEKISVSVQIPTQ